MQMLVLIGSCEQGRSANSKSPQIGKRDGVLIPRLCMVGRQAGAQNY